MVCMKWCPECDNILLPSRGKLFCRACNKYHNFEDGDEEKYKMVKTIKRDERDLTPAIMRGGVTGEKISADDRRAFDDFFRTND